MLNEGLYIYSLDNDMIFNPITLTEEIVPGVIQLILDLYSVALFASLYKLMFVYSSTFWLSYSWRILPLSIKFFILN